ncbi:hypothetical protein GCM10022405_18970 [Gibbsiella dentisursi]|uniref:Addiction module toxin RelE n=1 Tax=Gibbsiella dentisursi TaxID=796890 RepID=A0ABP7L4A4_9GAMM
MRGGVLESSARLCEIYMIVKYTQLAAGDKKTGRRAPFNSDKSSGPPRHWGERVRGHA